MIEPGDINVMILASCKSEEAAAKVLETFSRPMVGLILDGITITLMKGDADDS